MITANHPSMEGFIEFCYERQLVWYRRYVLQAPSPWTEDKLMQECRFTNVYRELDAVSQHLIEHVCSNAILSPENKLFNLIVGRVFNTRTVFTQIFPMLHAKSFDWKYFEMALDNKIKKGLKIWNPAYTVTQQKFDPSYRKEKHAQFLLLFDFIAKGIDQLSSSLQAANSLASAVQVLVKLPLIGDFLAAEIVQDLTYCKTFFHNGMDDNHDLAVVGPGTLQSIKEVHGLDESTPPRLLPTYVVRTHAQQPQLFEDLKQRTGKDWVAIHYQNAYSAAPYLSINNVESAFCEYRKYVNLSNGRGRKRYYREES